MKKISVVEMAKKWGMSERSVRNYCAKGRVEGATIYGKTWYIPENALKPIRKAQDCEQKVVEQQNINCDIMDIFASNVFSKNVMKQRLPDDVFVQFEQHVNQKQPLTVSVAKVIAEEMKKWALELGATHYSHWFQPLTGVTAEKHEGFLNRNSKGEPILKFSVNSLIKGESDASSFPSGGLRATFEARGYTAWDPSSPAFVKDGTLYVPTAFCAYGGEALDTKTPLLRAEQSLDEKARKLLGIFGKKCEKVEACVGAEQEYFLIDKKVYQKRLDLVTCGRTLFGAKPPKGQEMDDHYFGKIKSRVADFMRTLDRQLWRLGIFAKTKHNETAPSQHELASIFTDANLACDHNQLIMATMKSVANEKGMECLLHEKPFARVSGSGKHNNWSLSADGVNLFEPGETPSENLQFLLFMCAVMRAVDLHSDLLRYSVASASNDHRLGLNEAPPAVISMFLGDEISAVLQSIVSQTGYKEKKKIEFGFGVDVLPNIFKDTTDRNRTSPFAFTGNKFEFRMPGSSQSVANVNTVLNTIVAESIDYFCDCLKDVENVHDAVLNLIRQTVQQHGRIVFNGNNYSNEWLHESKRRGLPVFPTTIDAVKCIISEENIQLFEKMRVMTRKELFSRYEIMLETYSKQLLIEAETMIEMLNKDVLAGIFEYKNLLAKECKLLSENGMSAKFEKDLLKEICDNTDLLLERKIVLFDATKQCSEITETLTKANFCKDTLLSAMDQTREVVDKLETLVGKKYWTIPDYSDILFSVND